MTGVKKAWQSYSAVTTWTIFLQSRSNYHPAPGSQGGRFWKTDETNRETMVAYLVGTDAQQNVSATILDFDSYDRIRKQAEQLHYHQMLLEKDLAAQDTLNRQLIDELAGHVQALDQANVALQEAQRRLLSEGEQERKHLARELHDQVIQDLLGVNYQLESIEMEHKLPEILVGELGEIRQGIRSLSSTCDKSAGLCVLPPLIASGWALQFNPSPTNGQNEPGSRLHWM